MSRSQRSHATIEELISADVLDGLDELDHTRLEQELARHGPECPECLRLIADFSEVAGGLALAAEPVGMAAGAEQRLIDLAQRSEQGVKPARAPSPIRRLPRRWVAATAVAAAVALIAGAIAVGYAIAPRGPSVPSQFLAFVARPGTKVIAFPARGGQQLAVAVQPGQRSAWVVGSGLPDLSGDRVYELWFQPQPSAKMQPAGIFTAKDGRVVAPVTVGSSFVVLAVSVEPPGGSPQPTTTPIFLVSA